MNLTRIFAAFAFVVISASSMPAFAGDLFPPVGARDGVPCPNNQVLHWTGNSLICKDPTPGVTVQCPEGKLLAGIQNGSPICRDFPFGAQYSTGGVDIVIHENIGAFAYCRGAWGSVQCDNRGNVTCGRGVPTTTTMSHDNLGSGEIPSNTQVSPQLLMRDGAHVSHVDCIATF